MPGWHRRSRRTSEARGERTQLLVTGAAGLIGGILCDALDGEYVVRGLDVARGPHVERVADVSRLERIRGSFEGVDSVVDLAADASVSASWASVRENNMPATLNVLEAAREAGVRRVVFASSNHVVGMYEREEPYASIVAGAYDGLDPADVPRLTASVPIRPDGPYGVGKAAGEAAARYYADEHGLSVICLRIGTVNTADSPTEARDFATLLTHRDLVHLVQRCLSAPEDVRFAIFYGVSANTWRFWDIDEARRTIGYAPEDDAERWRSEGLASAT